MNLPRLKGKFVEHNKTYSDCAQMLGCSVTTVSNKMKGKVPFDCWEASKIIQWLGLSNEEGVEIFL